jgi:hypothetical protein
MWFRSVHGYRGYGDLVKHHEESICAANGLLFLQIKAMQLSRGILSPKEDSMPDKMSWDQRFFDPIILPGRKPLETLREAGNYVASLSEREQHLPHWQTATDADGRGSRWRPDDGADRHDAGAEPQQAESGDHAAPKARQGL